MDLISACPLRVASMVWQPHPGAFAFAFVCKATYLLAPGTSALAPVQEEPWLRDEAWDGDDRLSLMRGRDLVPFKRHADVILVGHVHAPGGRPVGSLLARLVACEVDKTIAVHGDRAFGSDDLAGEPAPFVRLPLRWERAAGGPGTANPVGMTADAPGARVPNLLPPGLHVVSRRSAIPPVGFMPVAPWWPGRIEKLRQHAAGWDHRRWSEQPLPDDVDAAYFNAAPPDQQVKEIRADEHIVLENLHREHPRLVTNLAPIAPRAVAELAGASPHEVRLRCDTLWIDADRGTASLVWRGNLRLAHPAQEGRVVVSMDAASSPAAAVGVSTTPALPDLAAAHAKFGGTSAMDPSILPKGDTLPFGQTGGATGGTMSLPAQPAPAAAPTSGVALPALAAAHAKFGSTAGVDVAAVVRGVALPFAPGVTTSPASPPAVREELPSLAPAKAPEVEKALPGLAAIHAKLGGTGGLDPEMVRRAAMPFGSASPVPAPVIQPPAHAGTPVQAPWAASGGDQPNVTAPVLVLGQAAPGDPAPPPLIGPLATPEMLTRAEPALSPEPTDAPAPAAPAASAAPAAAEEPLPPAVYPLERCAAITASIARRKDEKAAILERHELTVERWSAMEAHWDEAIRDEIERGKKDLLSKFDTAYVEQLEAERGPVTVDEYARLVVSAERGSPSKMLEALDLPRGAMPRLNRVWLKKVARSPGLTRQVNEAVRRAREG